jgi:DNA-binding MarR family transcriptional regulator
VAKLAEEIRMNKPFSFIEQEASLGILRTSDVLAQGAVDVLKPFDLTPPQFNVLRILRGSPDGLSCSQIADRMISRDPDVTRLLDRMEARNMLSRERSAQDRRVVLTRITAYGLELLASVDPAIAEMHRRQFRGISEKQIRQLIDLLEKVREALT